MPFDRRFGIIPALKCHHFLFNAANSYFTLLKTSKEKEVLIYSKREKYLKRGNEIFYDIIYFTVIIPILTGSHSQQCCVCKMSERRLSFCVNFPFDEITN